jgi:hypothetical protein
MTGFIVALVFFVLPEIDSLKPMKGMAAQLMAARRDDESVCFDGVGGGFSLLFYTEAGPVTSVGTNPTDVPPSRYFVGDRRALCVIAPPRYDVLRRAGVRLTLLARDPKMLLVAARR